MMIREGLLQDMTLVRGDIVVVPLSQWGPTPRMVMGWFNDSVVLIDLTQQEKELMHYTDGRWLMLLIGRMADCVDEG